MNGNDNNAKPRGELANWWTTFLANQLTTVFVSAVTGVLATLTAVEANLWNVQETLIGTSRTLEARHEKIVSMLNSITATVKPIDASVQSEADKISTLTKDRSTELSADIEGLSDKHRSLNNRLKDIEDNIEDKIQESLYTTRDTLEKNVRDAEDRLQQRIDNVRNSQRNDANRVLDAIRSLEVGAHDGQRRFGALMTELIEEGEGLMAKGDQESILMWMKRAKYMITSLPIERLDGVLKDRPLVASDVIKFVDRYDDDGTTDDQKRELAKDTLVLVTAVADLARVGKI